MEQNESNRVYTVSRNCEANSEMHAATKNSSAQIEKFLPFRGRPGGAAAAEVRRVDVESFGQPVQAGVKPDAPHHALPVWHRHAALRCRLLALLPVLPRRDVAFGSRGWSCARRLRRRAELLHRRVFEHRVPANVAGGAALT